MAPDRPRRAKARTCSDPPWLHRTVADATSIYNGYTGFVQRISGDRAAVLLKVATGTLVTLRLKDLSRLRGDGR